jgi:hypothetical protein
LHLLTNSFCNGTIEPNPLPPPASNNTTEVVELTWTPLHKTDNVKGLDSGYATPAVTPTNVSGIPFVPKPCRKYERLSDKMHAQCTKKRNANTNNVHLKHIPQHNPHCLPEQVHRHR